MPRGHKKSTPRATQLKIVRDFVKTGDTAGIAAKYDLNQRSILNIVKRNIDFYERLSADLEKSMELGASVVGNMAIDALRGKKLKKEKALHLSVIAKNMKDIKSKDGVNAVQVNFNIPTDREGILNFIMNTGKPQANTVDTTASIEDTEETPEQ
jgi:hypothetical protein